MIPSKAKPKLHFGKSSNMLLEVPPGAGIMQPRLRRPDGVTILGMSAVLASITLVLAGIALALGAGTASSGPESGAILVVLAFGYGGVGSLMNITAFATMILILAILYFATGIGFFWGRLWAWILGIALSLNGIVLNIIQISAWMPGLYFSAPEQLATLLILYYLTRPYVRNFFRKKILTTSSSSIP
jgi:hypothetical protein